MKKIVIIGGGFAGSYCAQHLEKRFAVTLIDEKDYFEFTPSIIRTLIEPGYLFHIQIKHHQYLSQTKIVIEKVNRLTSQEVHTANHIYPFDYLIISSGSGYAAPIKSSSIVINRAVELRQYAQRLVQAPSVVVLGGGIVGVELAAEIIENYPHKDITVIHSRPQLMDRLHPGAGEKAKRFLEAKGVKIILNRRIKDFTEEFKDTPSLVFSCTGIFPHSQFLPPSFLENGRVKVNSHLQVLNHPSIFSAGDVNNLAEEKTAQNAEAQAKIVVQNIICLEREKSLKEYLSRKRILVISLGEKRGIICFRWFSLFGRTAAILKRLIQWKTMIKKNFIFFNFIP